MGGKTKDRVTWTAGTLEDPHLVGHKQGVTEEDRSAIPIESSPRLIRMGSRGRGTHILE